MSTVVIEQIHITMAGSHPTSLVRNPEGAHLFSFSPCMHVQHCASPTLGWAQCLGFVNLELA